MRKAEVHFPQKEQTFWATLLLRKITKTVAKTSSRHARPSRYTRKFFRAINFILYILTIQRLRKQMMILNLFLICDLVRLKCFGPTNRPVFHDSFFFPSVLIMCFCSTFAFLSSVFLSFLSYARIFYRSIFFVYINLSFSWDF
jgi:hypothetical protein